MEATTESDVIKLQEEFKAEALTWPVDAHALYAP